MGGAAGGECGDSVESFCSRGRSAYVGFSCLFLLAPIRRGTSFLCKREKKRSKETRFKPSIFKCRRRSLQVFGTNVARPSQPQPALEHPPQAPTARTRSAPTAPTVPTLLAAAAAAAAIRYGQRQFGMAGSNASRLALNHLILGVLVRVVWSATREAKVTSAECRLRDARTRITTDQHTACGAKRVHAVGAWGRASGAGWGYGAVLRSCQKREMCNDDTKVLAV